ncbi:MAG: NAD(P)/FAD-dependent oxidoreductase [Thermodesulfobacteriota bacterium]
MDTADAVVIGGGVIGTAAAYYLAETGRKVTLIERNGIAAGTSSRCEGFILVNDKMPGYDARLGRLSQSLFPGLSDEIGFDIEWSPRGSLLLIESKEEMAVAEDFCGRLAAEGLDVRMLDRRRIHEIEPHLAEDILGGMETATDGAVNPMALAQGLARAAQKRGAAIRTGATVRDIRLTSSGKMDRIITDGPDILTPTVINAAGIRAPEIGRMVGVEIPITPRQGQILVTERTFGLTRRKVMEFGYLMTKFEKEGYRRRVTPEMEANGVAFVLEPTGAGNFLIGSSRRFTGFDTTTDPTVIRAIAERAVRFYPALARARLIRTYAGLRPYTPDHFPIISPTPVDGFFVAAGHEGNGITLSLITGKLTTQMIAGESPDIDLKPLRLDRFDSENPHAR